MLRSLRVPDRVVGHLTGDATVAPQVSPLLIEVPGLRTPDADRFARALRTGAAIGHVRAAAGTAGLATAQGCCDLLGVAGLVVDLSRRPAGSDPVELVRLGVREAGLRTACLVLTGDDSQIAGNGALFEILEEAPVPVVVVDELGLGARLVPGTGGVRRRDRTVHHGAGGDVGHCRRARRRG